MHCRRGMQGYMLHRTARCRIDRLHRARGCPAGLCDGAEHRQDARRRDRPAAASTGCGGGDTARSDGRRGRVVEGFSARSTRRLVRSDSAGEIRAPGRGCGNVVPRRSDHHRLRACRCVTNETVRRRMAAESGPLQVDAGAAGCPPDGTCGFRAGDRVLIYAPDSGDGAHDILTLVGRRCG